MVFTVASAQFGDQETGKTANYLNYFLIWFYIGRFYLVKIKLFLMPKVDQLFLETSRVPFCSF